jgi:hypothetical protein
MRKYFSWIMLLGIFFFGLTEWSRSLHQNYTVKKPESAEGLAEYASVPGVVAQVPRRPTSLFSSTSPVDRAKEYLEQNRQVLGLKEYHEFRPEEYKTPLSTHVRFSVFEKGTQILNLGIEVEIGRDNEVKLVEKQYWDLQPGMEPSQAIPLSKIMARYQDVYRVDEASLSEKPVLSASEGSATPERVYVLSAREKNGKRVQLLIRANDGNLAAKLYSRSEFK